MPLLPLRSPAYGGDWNPEQWDPATIESDLAMMHEAGVTLITLGVFSWSRLEPSEGHYDLDWLGDLIDRLHTEGIAVDLATGTASPPAWMTTGHPETLPVDACGVRLGFGSRQQLCPSSPIIAERTRALAGELARRFGHHPGVALWHIGNEYACHIHECFCPTCAKAFRTWLRRRYADIEGLNTAWGTDFWSQHYSDFAQVTPPRVMPTFHNPGQQLDWRRFCDHQIHALLLGEIEEVRTHSDRPVTTNFMGSFPWLDYRQWARDLDVISDDSYPDPADPAAAHDIAWQGDLMRGLAGGAPWLLMEQAPSAVQWRARNSPKRPGQFLLWSLDRMAHGADGVLQFQWRQSRQGAETFHSGMVPHAGRASRTWDEVVEAGRVLSHLSEVMGTRVHAEVALVVDWESEWARAAAIGPNTPEGFMVEARAWHRTLWEDGIAVDIVGPDDDLESYALVLVPALFVDRPELAARLTRAARRGAQIVVTGPAGVVHSDLSAVLGGYLGSLRDLLGVVVVDHVALSGPLGRETDDPAIADGDGSRARDAAESSRVRSHFVNRLTREIAAPGAATWVGLEPDVVPLRRVLDRMGPPAPDLRGGTWAEVLVLADGPECGGAEAPWSGSTEVIATYDGRAGGLDLAGFPAITRRIVEPTEDGAAGTRTDTSTGAARSGGAWYVGTDLDALSRTALVRLVAAHARVRPTLTGLPDGVEAVRRGEFLFLLNHGDAAVEVTGVVGLDLVSGAECTGHVLLAPRSGMVVRG